MHIITIVGRSGSGKSTLSFELERALTKAGYTTSTLHMDDYYYTLDDPFLYDTPESVNMCLLKMHIQFLSAHATVHYGARVIPAPQMLIVEGIFPLQQEVLATIQLTTDSTTSWFRRLARGGSDKRIPRWYVDEMHLIHGKPTPSTLLFRSPGENHPSIIAASFVQSLLNNNFLAPEAKI